MRLILVLALALVVGCGGSADSGDDAEAGVACERSAYELERTRYRCTSVGELQTLECGEWETLDVCASPDACSPGPVPGCE